MQENPELPSKRAKALLSGAVAVGGIVVGLALTAAWVVALLYCLGWLVVWVAKLLM